MARAKKPRGPYKKRQPKDPVVEPDINVSVTGIGTSPFAAVAEGLMRAVAMLGDMSDDDFAALEDRFKRIGTRLGGAFETGFGAIKDIAEAVNEVNNEVDTKRVTAMGAALVGLTGHPVSEPVAHQLIMSAFGRGCRSSVGDLIIDTTKSMLADKVPAPDPHT